MNTFQDAVSNYKNDSETNDRYWETFHQLSYQIDFISEHRDYIEKHQLGFGDRSFHYMWYLILNYLSEKKSPLNCLEIGVYKGQILSLWALYGKKMQKEILLTGISPLEGNFRKTNRFIFNLMKLKPNFRKIVKTGNHYEYADYATIVRELFAHFDLNLEKLNLIKGFSCDETILNSIKDKKYDIIYVDGDHSYNGVINDLKNFIPKLNDDGIMVMDDASLFLPGTKYWKGHKEVSEAAEIMPGLYMQNVLNIGHNRVFIKKN